MPLPRRRRPRQLRRRYTGPQPKLKVGNIRGDFTVVEYLGHSAIRPDKLKRLSQEHHWYKVRCSCGSEETHSQQQLIDTRRHRKCQECLSKES